MDIQPLLSLVHKAGEAVREIYSQPFEITWKGKDDPLTQADLAANQIILSGLRSIYPEDGFLSEEEKENPERRVFSRIWILDPIDGTREFVNKNPEFAISLGLSINGIAELGFILNPATGESIYGGKDFGLFFTPNFLEIPYSPVSLKSKPSVKPHLLLSHSEVRDGFFTEEYWTQKFFTQPMGSIAYKLALIAIGKADLVVSVRPKNEWDVCGGIALIRAAGLDCFTLHTFQEYKFNEENLLKSGILAGKPEIIRTMMKEDSDYLKNSYRPRK